MRTGLRKDLGLLAVYCTATGAMISSGLFVLPGIAHAAAGPAVVLSYILAGLLATTGMLSQAELVSAMPKAGGTYFCVTRSMGPAVGTVDGLLTWLSFSLKTAFALVGLAAFTSPIAGVDHRIVAAGLCLFFTGANLIGIKEAARLQVALVIGLLIILGIYVVVGLPRVDVSNIVPFSPNGTVAVLSTAGLVFVSYGGLLISAISEEVRNASRTIPLAMALSLFTVVFLYAGVVFVTSGTVPDEQLNASLTPITDGARQLFGRKGAIFLSAAAILAFISTANAGIMSASRYPLALSRDKLLPERMGSVNQRFGTPHVAIITTGAIIFFAVIMNLEFLIKTASAVLILTFLSSCLCVIIMRESHLQNYRPRFKSPLYPWIQIVGALGCATLLVEMGLIPLLIAGGLIAAGLFIYWFYGRIRTTREYALLHLVERLTRRDLTAHMLEDELKEIIKERDHIVTDRFDHLTTHCPVIDVKEAMTLKTCFKLAGEKLADITTSSADELAEELQKREADSSTAISPFIAIPHIERPGADLFKMVIIRCRGGIRFSDEDPAVKAVFVLAGSKDQRNFHLKALAAIAQIGQSRDFEKRWLRARRAAGLRDVIQLGRRVREQD